MKEKTKYSDNESSRSESAAELKQQIDILQKQLETLRRVEENLRESEENFRDIFETVEEGIAYGTLRGKLLSINKKLELILGIPGEKIIGRNVMRVSRDLLNSENSNIVLPLLHDVVRGRPIRPFEVRYRDKLLEVSVSINNKTKRLTGTIRDVTESRKIQNELKIGESRLRRAEIASKSGNWELHLKTGIMIGSEGAVLLYGVKGSPIDMKEIQKVPLPEFRPMMDKALEGLIKHGKPYDIEFKIRKADTGEIIDIHSIAEYDRENQILFGSIQDITERKRAERVIMRNNRDLAQLLQITMDLLETVERKEVLKRILEGAIRLIELDTGVFYFLKDDTLRLEVTVPPIPDNFPEEFRKANINCHPHIKKAITTNTPVIVYNIYDEELTPEEKLIADNKDLHSMIYIPLAVNKQVIGVLILGTVSRAYEFSDREIRLSRTISNIASLTIENSLLFDNLTVAKEKAEESDRLKTAFLHNISHEIRTPLNAIIGFSGFLDQPDISEDDRKEYIDIIFQSNNQLLSIINDILNISHIETGQAKLKISQVDINKVLKNLHRQFLPEAERKNVRIKIGKHREDCKAILQTDESKLIQIMSNLISNALKFTDEGYVEFGYVSKDDHVEFYVEDTGIGIAASEQPRIFERFYQVDKKDSRNYGGTGLGLPISKGYTELLGGKIWLKSELNSGSAFYFTIPCSHLHQEVSAEETEVKEIKGKSGKNKSILVAEDEESNFALITTMLRHQDYEIMRARNGQEAVDMFKKRKDTSLILMDIKMPLMDGFEAASEILKIKPNVPIVAQSAYVHQADKTLAMEIGFVDYIAKPFDRQQLLSVVEKYIK
ncbi:MAG: ATP-binding protein [Bacteroidota bacterium]